MRFGRRLVYGRISEIAISGQTIFPAPLKPLTNSNNFEFKGVRYSLMHLHLYNRCEENSRNFKMAVVGAARFILNKYFEGEEIMEVVLGG